MKPIITVDQDALRRQNIIKKVTTSVLAELNRVYQVETSTSFTDVVVRFKSSTGLEKKKDQKDKRKERSNNKRNSQKRSMTTSLRRLPSQCSQNAS